MNEGLGFRGRIIEHVACLRLQYTPSSGVPRSPISRSANSDSPLERQNLYGRQLLRCRACAPLPAISRRTPLKGGVYCTSPKGRMHAHMHRLNLL